MRIEDFTGFACTVTETVVEEGGEPERGGSSNRKPAAPSSERSMCKARLSSASMSVGALPHIGTPDLAPYVPR